MPTKTLNVSDARGRLPELIDEVAGGRVTITRHGRPKAVLMSIQESDALDETLAILDDDRLVRDIRQGLRDVAAGRVRKARDVFAELDREFDAGKGAGKR